MNFEEGSVWRKWDFHIHSPYSILNNQYGFNPWEIDNETELEDHFDEYVKQLFTRAISKDIAAIGITDYFSVNGYSIIREKYLNNPKKLNALFPDSEMRSKVQQIYVFPNIEFRLNTFVGEKSSAVNYHVIFSDGVSVRDIEENFLQVITFESDSGEQSTLTRSNLEKFGKIIKKNNNQQGSDLLVALKNVTVSSDTIRNALKSQRCFTGKYILTIPVDEDLSKIKWDGRDYTTRKNLYKQCNCYMSANKNTIAWALAEGEETERRNEFGAIKPCIWGSDAHDYEHMFASTKSCWIKSDPTFEGLLQIFYEPKDRVAISDIRPDSSRDEHSIIHSIHFDDKNFQGQPIFFNNNLTCIIGGKSTGKSLLIEQLARAIDSDYVDQQLKVSAFQPPKKKFPISNSTVIWKDGTSETRKIVYIPQTYLNRTIDNPEEDTAINQIIERVLLKESTIAQAHEELETKREQIIKSVNNELSEYFLTLEKLKKLQDKIKEEGHSDVFAKTLSDLEKERSELATKIDISEEEINRYGELEKYLISLNERKISSEAETEKLQKAKSPKIIFPEWTTFDGSSYTNDLESEFSLVYNELHDYVDDMQLSVSSLWEGYKEKLIKALREIEAACKKELQEAKLEYDVLKVKMDQSSHLQKLSERISEERTKLNSAKVREQDEKQILDQLKKLRNNIICSQAKLQGTYDDYCKVVDANIHQNTELDFEAQTIWKKTDFQQGLSALLDNRKFNAFKTQYEYDLNDLNFEKCPVDFLNVIWDALLGGSQKPGALSPKGSTKCEEVLKFVFKDWFNVHYLVKSGNDTMEEMSPGKKALVLLELLINLEDSKCPILIDQPEDDLDNRSIYEDLVRFIRAKKNDRQIIVVTHNANVVLGADAEEIIIANQMSNNTPNEMKRFEYRSGSIENDEILYDSCGNIRHGILNQKGIQTQICDILEGGRTAFELRQNKYSNLLDRE